MLLNAADSLDIGRVTEFDFKYFPFLRGGEQEGPKALVPEYQNLRQALHEEADLLARMTDPLTQTRDLRMKLIQAGDRGHGACPARGVRSRGRAARP